MTSRRGSCSGSGPWLCGEDGQARLYRARRGAAKKEEGLNARMVQFKLTDPEPLLYHNEPIMRNGEVVSFLTSGVYGHHLGAAMGMGYIPCEGKVLLTFSARPMRSTSWV